MKKKDRIFWAVYIVAVLEYVAATVIYKHLCRKM